MTPHYWLLLQGSLATGGGTAPTHTSIPTHQLLSKASWLLQSGLERMSGCAHLTETRRSQVSILDWKLFNLSSLLIKKKSAVKIWTKTNKSIQIKANQFNCVPHLRIEVSVINVFVMQVDHSSAYITGQVHLLSPAQGNIFPGQKLFQTATVYILKHPGNTWRFIFHFFLLKGFSCNKKLSSKNKIIFTLL